MIQDRLPGAPALAALFLCLAFALLAAMTAPAAAHASRSHFTGDENAAIDASAGPIERVSIYIQRQQQIFYRRFSTAIRELRAGYSFEATMGLALIAFLYGVFHAAGPGHGKAVISAYMLANERSVRRGIILASLASLAQAVTAIVATYGLLFGLAATGSRIRAVTANLEIVSFAMVAGLGAFMLWRAAAPLLRVSGHGHAVAAGPGHHHAHAHAPGEACDECGHAHIPPPALLDRPLTVRTALPVIASIGLRPCTGAVVVLVFAHALGLHLAGIGATFAMSVGTAITVAILASLAVGSRDLAGRLFGGNAVWLTAFYRIIALAGAAAVLAIGLILLYGAVNAPTRAFI